MKVGKNLKSAPTILVRLSWSNQAAGYYFQVVVVVVVAAAMFVCFSVPVSLGWLFYNFTRNGMRTTTATTTTIRGEEISP
jgi:hypothetical protein